MLDELKHIPIADYDYPLPDERIARYPLPERDHSKLLCLRGDDITEHRFYDLPQLLPQGAMLVFNDTKVIHARLLFRKATGAIIEIFCLEPYHMPVAQAFEERGLSSWVCMVGNNKRWRGGDLTGQCMVDGEPCTLTATRRDSEGHAWVVDFRWTGGFSFAEVIEHAGVIPLPPYLGREAEDSDSQRYQTVYAHHEGSVAAPTAGLHFTPALLEQLGANGVQTEYLTLHVGAGTFKPVSTDTIGEHEMHVEKVFVTDTNLQHLIAQAGRPLLAVGTTSVRTLESIYWFGVQLQGQPDMDEMHVSQWDPYTLDDHGLGYADACANVLQWMRRKGMDHFSGETQLMIAPGYRYRSISGLITNFHQPKSTLLLLVSALIGERWRDCYQYALDHDFRFLSYGDSCLFLP